MAFAVRISQPHMSGLCNQLTALINGIIAAKRSANHHIILGPFSNCIKEQLALNISKIIDLEETSKKIGDGIILTDGMIRILYGIDNNYVDITDKVMKECISAITHHIEITNDDVVRSILFGDHLPNVKKNIIVWKDGNKYNCTDEKPISISLKSIYSWDTMPFNMGWYDYYDNTLFDEIIRRLTFNHKFYDIVENIYKCLGIDPLSDVINVIHLRLERDGIKHWSVQNKMNQTDYTTFLLNKYLQLIEKIPCGENLLILTADVDHPFIKDLRNKYIVHTYNHNEVLMHNFGIAGRELNAIVDMLLGSYCNGIFIGCHNLEFKRGSTFSYFLYQMIKHKCKQTYFIDLDNILA